MAKRVPRQLLGALAALMFAPMGTVWADRTGPLLRLTRVEIDGDRCVLEGYARDADSSIRDVSFSVSRYEGKDLGPDSRAAVPLDGAFDSATETFSVAVSTPLSRGSPVMSGYIITLRASDASGDASYMQIRGLAGYDGSFDYLTYLSASALGAKKTEFANFTLYHTPDVPKRAVAKVREKLMVLRKEAERYFGFKEYDHQSIMLYGAGKDAGPTFGNYRGVIEEGVFSFPLRVTDVSEVSGFHRVLDSWMPHELGDHSTRKYAPGENNRWLSEGVGDYLRNIHVEANFPGRGKDQALIRVELFEGNPRQVEKVDLLDGDWSGAHYLCSAAFVVRIVGAHGVEVFKELFSGLNGVSSGELSDARARAGLSELTGEDVTSQLRDCSTKEAVATLRGVRTGEGPNSPRQSNKLSDESADGILRRLR
ncbi:hypothetical protein ACFL2T_02515 [Elusimicrobiota bacterium]